MEPFSYDILVMQACMRLLNTADCFVFVGLLVLLATRHKTELTTGYKNGWPEKTASATDRNIM